MPTTESVRTRNFKGWTVRLERGRYYYLVKKIQGRKNPEKIYLGKEFDPERASQEIAEREEALRKAGYTLPKPRS